MKHIPDGLVELGKEDPEMIDSLKGLSGKRVEELLKRVQARIEWDPKVGETDLSFLDATDLALVLKPVENAVRQRLSSIPLHSAIKKLVKTMEVIARL